MTFFFLFFFFQAEDGIRDYKVTGVQTCALPISILGKRIGPVQLAFNPVIERALREGETSGGGEWEFEPSARVGVTLSRVVELNLEYFGKTGVLGSALPAGQQVHQFYPGVDLKLGDDLELNLGVGFGATSAGNQLVFKSRCEIPLGR